jgi:diguanylate cyclase (GGDEF)-like protein
MTALIVLAAIAAAVLIGVLAWVVARRAAARSAEARVTGAVAELTERLDELSAELQRALERAERRDRRGELTASLDLDEVVGGVLEQASAYDGVETAVVSLDGGAEERTVAAVGMPLEEARRETFTTPSGSADSRRIVLPLVGGIGRLGFLAVTSTFAGELPGRELEELAQRAGPALDNALRYREARRLADLDALTGLHNRRYFHETLQRECARAQRYGRRLALMVLDVDDFKSTNEQFGHLAGDTVLADAGARVRSVLRASDIACRVGGDEFAIILPEAGVGDAEQLYRRIHAAVSEEPIGRVERLTFSAGIAALAATDDAKSFFERADNALYRAKNAGKARVLSADG